MTQELSDSSLRTTLIARPCRSPSSRDESHPMVDTLLRTRVPRWEELNRAIDERDDMLDFAIQLFDHDRDRR